MWTYPLGRMHTLLIKSERTKTHSTLHTTGTTLSREGTQRTGGRELYARRARRVAAAALRRQAAWRLFGRPSPRFNVLIKSNSGWEVCGRDIRVGVTERGVSPTFYKALIL
ncbi:hypothetical protein CDAR_567631 [Caerostris darwini]|uniref:Uncharacterized protein n=1 Tax=Caerostris darwini TaxID=1538125 RepID=A0AAV4QUB2_9ARAC|nr:hypothetical protein CDAR_567631 [Caerostris darwini]